MHRPGFTSACNPQRFGIWTRIYYSTSRCRAVPTPGPTPPHPRGPPPPPPPTPPPAPPAPPASPPRITIPVTGFWDTFEVESCLAPDSRLPAPKPSTQTGSKKDKSKEPRISERSSSCNHDLFELHGIPPRPFGGLVRAPRVVIWPS